MSAVQTVWVDEARCTGCGACVSACPTDAISLLEGKARVDQERCTGCGACVSVCPVDAIQPVVQGEIVLAPERPAPTLYRPSPLVETAGAAVAVAGTGLLMRAAGGLARAVGRWLMRRLGGDSSPTRTGAGGPRAEAKLGRGRSPPPAGGGGGGGTPVTSRRGEGRGAAGQTPQTGPVRWPSLLALGLLLAGCGQVEQRPLPTPTPSPAPTATRTATPAPTATPEPTLTPTEEVQVATWTILYDNNAYDPALQTGWGFACLVETEAGTVLFDTGADAPTLLGNMAQLGIDPQAIDVIVLSHVHGDHTGGLAGLLDTGIRPTVYAPEAFPASFKESIRARTELVDVTGPQEIIPGLFTTGEMGTGIVEEALVVETGEGLVVVTGCAHPGVVNLVRRAKESVGGQVALVMGGFHLGSASRAQIESIIADFEQLGVRQVAPCHCTGDLARQMFAEAFGADFVPAGVGRVIMR